MDCHIQRMNWIKNPPERIESMSQETEQDLLAKRVKAEQEIADIDKAIELIKSKPDPRFGDFGSTGRMNVLVSHKLYSHEYCPEEVLWLHSVDAITCGRPASNLKCFGNIFGLMIQGPILVALTVEEAESAARDRWNPWTTMDSVRMKTEAALAKYNEAIDN